MAGVYSEGWISSDYIKLRDFQFPFFEQAIIKLVKIHPTLRSSFNTHAFSLPVQIVHKELFPKIKLENLTSEAPEKQQFHIQDYLANDRKNKFNPNEGLLWRIRLFQLEKDYYCMALSFQHAILDGWSVSIFLKQLFNFYQKLSQGEAVTSLLLKSSYKDYVALNLKRFVSKKTRTYWVTSLEGYSRTKLPFNYVGKNIWEDQGVKMVYQHVGETLIVKLEKKAKSLQCTLKEICLTAHIFLLRLLTTDFDVVTGVVTHERPILEDSEKVLGCYLNTIPARFEVRSEVNKLNLLIKVQEYLTEVKEHEIFLEDIVKITEITGHEGNPIFETIFNYTDFSITQEFAKFFQRKGHGEVVEAVQMTNTLFDVEIHKENKEIHLVIKYATRYFHEKEIRIALDLYVRILEQFTSEEKSMNLEELYSQEENLRLIRELNSTQVVYPKGKTLFQLFEEQSQKTPDHIAVLQGNNTLTYQELYDRSNQLAHFLIKFGVQTGNMVGCCMERSIDMIVGLMGILKTGAAYIPMDPGFPTERLGYMLEDSEASVVVTQKKLVELLPKNQTKILCMDSQKEEIAKESTKSLEGETNSNQLAYIIFTSGSTGRPKGVQIEHKAVVNFLNSMKKEPGFTEKDILLSVTTISFDISVLELFLPILNGGQVVIATKEECLDGIRLQEMLLEHKISVMQATPATWRLLYEGGWQGNAQLKVLCGGESLPPDLAQKLAQDCSSLWNMYGPTETTIWSSVEQIRKNEQIISIGHPIDNTQMYILNEQRQMLPMGITGELYIGGDGLSRGYLDLPELTQEKFVPNPFSKNKESLIYNTGDLARYLPDGRLECLGRKDHQVKVRGFRIELGEIESIIVKHPSIHTAAATVREETPGSQLLVAYCVLEKGKTPDNTELTQFLQQSLPEYMIPSHFVFIEEMPLTPNGKIDRKSLPSVQLTQSEKRDDFVPPSSDLEKDIAQIWQEVLQLDRVSIHDNFVALGGHSLRMAQVHRKLQKGLNRRIPLLELLKYITIASLSQFLTKQISTERQLGEKSRESTSMVELQKGRTSRKPLFLVHPAGGSEYIYVELVRLLNTDLPVYAFTQSYDELEKFSESVEVIAKLYLNELRRSFPEGPYILGGYSFGGLVALEMAQQLNLEGEEVSSLIVIDAPVPERFTVAEDSTSFLLGMVSNQFPISETKLRNLSVEEQLAFVAEEAKKFNLFPIFGPWLQAAIFHGIMKNQKIIKDYKLSFYEGKTLFFSPEKEMKHAPNDAHQFWIKSGIRKMDVFRIPGNHISMIHSPNVEKIATILNQKMEKFEGRKV